MIRPFKEHEIKMITSRYPLEGAIKLAEDLGRNRRQISAKAWSLGLIFDDKKSHDRRRIFTPEEDIKIRRLWPEIIRRNGISATKLAREMGVSRHQLFRRAADLGVRQWRFSNGNWSDEEIDLLTKLVHLAPRTIEERFAKSGYRRTATAIVVQRKRMNLLVTESFNAYSACALAHFLGITNIPVLGWIKRGLLKATSRGDSVNELTGGPGDRWIIYPEDVRRFIIDNAALVDISRADKFWLIDLLANDPGKARHKNWCGISHEAAGGFEDHRIGV